MANALHNIICLEAEWEYRNAKSNKFSLNAEPLLNWLRKTGLGHSMAAT